MFSIIGITGRVGGGAASRLLGLGKQVRAVVRDEAKGHVWASKGASVAVADMTDSDGLGRGIAGYSDNRRQSESLLFRRLAPTSPSRICSMAFT